MLVNILLDTCRRLPDKLAVSDATRSLTYKRLTLLSEVLANIIQKETTCERVGIMLPASTVFPAVLFGSLWSSKIAVPLNFLLGPDELATIVDDAKLDLVITARHFEKLASRLPARPLYLEDLPLRRKTLLAMLTRRPPAPTAHPNTTAVILYTSGTTADPKGVELTHGNLHSNCVDTIHSLNIQPDYVLLNVLPPFHVFGLTVSVLMTTMLGLTVHAIPRFSPVALVKTVSEKKVSAMMAIPSMYAAVLRMKSATAASFRSMRFAVCGGEPLSDRIRTGFEQRFGVSIRVGYGLTETSPIVSACSIEENRPGTVGKPIRNVELRIVGDEGADLPTGQEGEVLVRSPGVMKGYYNRPEESRRVLDDEGWFKTGDVGRLDDDGFLTLTGRLKELLIIGGENVSPREIEAALESHDGVLQAAVIGIPDESRGEAPVAFVIPNRGADPSEQTLRNHAKTLLAGYKVPKQIHAREDLPTGPTGKILKRRLHDLV
ncbi:MAG: AMP-binding protein [Phycisphaerae bacterium]|jgi:long-chain acyl-CoA synthetase